MKLKKWCAACVAAMLCVASVFALTACGEGTGNPGEGGEPQETAAKVIDVYQSQARLKAFHVRETSEYWVSEAFTVELYSDGTYVCNINITEDYQSLKDFEYDQVNIIKPMAVSFFTRFGSYELTKDEALGTFSLKLGKADRLIYATNAGGGHYPLVPTNNVVYVDSTDAEATAAFDTEWYGDWNDLEALVGAEVTLTGDSTTHMFDAGTVIFEYKTPMWYTLDGSEIW